ncbi:MAG: hypothetical protein LBK58_16095 [Prevotellaceae bacterium]|jgi:hypothetical protein|nr:hypothetical protein [Prevotellaceae bacterium]
MKTVNIIPPKNWNQLDLHQWHIIQSLQGKYTSRESYLAKAFVLLCGLKPLPYAERWREVLSSFPIVGQWVRCTGRQVYGRSGDVLLWRQYYQISRDRVWIADEDIRAFTKGVEWLAKERILTHNPVRTVTIGDKMYHSPKRRLSDLTWERYNLAKAALELYDKSKNILLLHHFVAALYGIDEADITKIPGAVSEFEISLMTFYWDGCHYDLAKSFPHLFKTAEKKDENKKQADYLKSETEITVFISKQSFSKPDEVRGMNVRDAFEYLEQQMTETELHRKELNRVKAIRHH